jgi:hypothetical protein
MNHEIHLSALRSPLSALRSPLSALFVFVSLSTSASAIIDEDSDGMSDLWETQYGFSRFDDGTLTPSQAPGADPDGDGLSNALESVAGTNPNSAAGPVGAFKTTMAANPLLAGTFNLQFAQFVGKEYQLQSSTDLQTWVPVGDPLLGTATAVTLATPLPPAGTQKIFYRISVRDTDFDFDSLSSYEESIICSNPNNPDSDGDGAGDKTEYENGSDPCSSADGGVPPPITPGQLPPAKLIKVRLYTATDLGPTYGQISPSGQFLTPYDVNVYKKHKITGAETLVYTMNYSGVNPFVFNDISLPNLPDFVYTIQATIPDLSNSSLVPQYRDFSFIVNAGQLPDSAPFTVRARFDPAVNSPLGDFGSVGFNHGTPYNPHAIGLGAYRIVLSTLDIDEVISDQIAGNDANKLPTRTYGGQPNNPMVMATRTGNDARLRVKINAFAPLASKLLIAVREVASGTIKGSTVPIVDLLSVPITYNAAISFAASNGSLLHEVVVGQDTNGNGTLEVGEVKAIFEKTPRLDVSGGAYSGADTTFKFLDRIIVITESDFSSARDLTQGYSLIPDPLINLPGTPNLIFPTTKALLKAFSTGANTIPGTTTDFGILVSANGIGIPGSPAQSLSLPLGARWNSSNEASTHRIVYANGSAISEKIKSSQTLKLLIGRIIYNNKASLAAAATTASPNFTTVTLNGIIDKDVSFGDKDPRSDAHYTLGKCRFEGSLEVSLRAIPGGYEVAQVNCSGSFNDLYDYSWPGIQIAGGIIDTKNATITQAGHATLTSATIPDAGRIFFTKVNVGTGIID